MTQDNKATAVHFLRLLEKGDFTGMRTLCTPTATVWHNDGQGEQGIEDNLAGLEKMTTGSVGSLRYDIIRQFDRPDEVLQQHVLNITNVDDSAMELHVAMYFGFKDGLIDRIEEYANFTTPSPEGPSKS